MSIILIQTRTLMKGHKNPHRKATISPHRVPTGLLGVSKFELWLESRCSLGIRCSYMSFTKLIVGGKSIFTLFTVHIEAPNL